jgi:hypothetical protein
MLKVLLVSLGQDAAAREALVEIKARIFESQRYLLDFQHEIAAAGRKSAVSTVHHDCSILHLTARGEAATVFAPRPADRASIGEFVQALVGRPDDERESDGGWPCVLLDAWPEEQKAVVRAGPRVGSILELPAELDDDAARSFVATFYEALVAGHTLQTAFWLGCCRTWDQGGDRPPVPCLVIPKDIDPRTVRIGCDLKPGLPPPTPDQFYDLYDGLCTDIKQTIAMPYVSRFTEIVAVGHEGNGPLAPEVCSLIANDFADLIIAIYQGPRALALQRAMFERHRDPSGVYPDLYEWTIHTEVEGEDLAGWLKEQAAGMIAQTADEVAKGGGFVNNFRRNALAFLDDKGVAFTEKIGAAYRRIEPSIPSHGAQTAT